MVWKREKERPYWNYNKGVKRGNGCLQGNPHWSNPASMGRFMESKDEIRMVSSNEKCGLSAGVGLSKD